MQIGIIGLANVGKSTLFNALTQADVPALNYPFCTIEPNVGVVMIPDQRFMDVVDLVKPEKATGAVIKFVDIAGLVRGASRGEGLGNKFLSHIREVDAVIHVIRAFADPNVSAVEGSVDPLRDLEIVETELILADLQTLENRIERVTRMLKTGERKYAEELELLKETSQHLNNGRVDLIDVERLPNDLRLLSVKPVLFVINVDEEQLGEPDQLEQQLAPLKEKASARNSEVLLVCADLEADLADLSPDEAEEYFAEYGLEASGLTRIIEAVELSDILYYQRSRDPGLACSPWNTRSSSSW